MSPVLRRISTILSMIKIQHAIFALPWAFVAALYAVGDDPIPWPEFGWILLAMIAARSAALAFNRFADAKLDADNPRTAGRAIPKGRVSPAFTLAFAVVMAGLLVLAAGMLNPLCLKLSPVACDPAVNTDYWILGTAGSTELGTTTVLAYDYAI